MSNSQSVYQLLNKFDLNLELADEVLDLKIDEEYESYKIIQRVLSFINSEGQMDYGDFECIHFENEDTYCEIVPECNLQTVLLYSKLKGSGRWAGCSFDCFGEISVRS